MAIINNRRKIYIERESPGRRRTLAILLAIVLSYLLVAEIAPSVGLDLTGTILSKLGISRPGSQVGAEGPAGSAGAAGADGIDGTNGLNGADGAPGTAGIQGADGAPGTNGLNGADGAPGTNGLNGADGAPGTNGVDGVVLNQNEGEIGFGACDTNVGVSLSSRIDTVTATFLVDRIRFTGVAEGCFGSGLRIYLFSGTEGSYVLEATSDIITIPSSATFEFDNEALNIGSVRSSVLTKMAFEITG